MGEGERERERERAIGWKCDVNDEILNPIVNTFPQMTRSATLLQQFKVLKAKTC